jgi:hypothetical protein
VARFGGAPDQPEFQAFAVTNADGMIDFPPQPFQSGRLRVLVMGGANVDGATVPLSVHFHRRLSEFFGRPIDARKLAHPGMGLARLAGWYAIYRQDFRPNVVVLGLGADALGLNLARYSETIFDRILPGGPALTMRDDEVVLRPAAPWGIGRSSRPPPRNFPSLAGALDANGEIDWNALRRLVKEFSSMIRQDGGKLVLLVEECGEHHGLWRPSTPVSAWAEGHDRLRARLDDLAVELGASLADPYSHFLALGDVGQYHWRECAGWNIAGHRVAAKAIVESFGPLGHPITDHD